MEANLVAKESSTSRHLNRLRKGLYGFFKTALIVSVALPSIVYGLRVMQSEGEWRWDRQTVAMEEDLLKLQREREKQEKWERLRKEKYNLLTRLASGEDGYLSIPEQIDAWKRMRLLPEKIYVESERAPDFREPQLGHLERGIASYEK